jgi:hypothetical protein
LVALGALAVLDVVTGDTAALKVDAVKRKSISSSSCGCSVVLVLAGGEGGRRMGVCAFCDGAKGSVALGAKGSN